jgi:hypothetical protein
VKWGYVSSLIAVFGFFIDQSCHRLQRCFGRVRCENLTKSHSKIAPRTARDVLESQLTFIFSDLRRSDPTPQWQLPNTADARTGIKKVSASGQ